MAAGAFGRVNSEAAWIRHQADNMRPHWWTGLTFVDAVMRFKRHGWVDVGWGVGRVLMARPDGVGQGYWVTWGGILELAPQVKLLGDVRAILASKGA